jgi:hypothetical protein
MSTNLEISEKQNLFFWRLCIWTGAVYLVGSLVSWAGIAGFVPPPQASWTAEQMTTFYQQNSFAIRAGMVLTILFQPFYFVLAAGIAKVMGRIEGRNGILGTLQLLGGFWTSIFITICLGSWLTAAYYPELRTPQEIKLLNELAWFLIDVPASGTMIQCCAFGIVFLLDKRDVPLVPRWFCWISFFVAFSDFADLLIPFFREGPFCWNGLISFWVVYTLYFFWIIPVVFYMIKATYRLEREIG